MKLSRAQRLLLRNLRVCDFPVESVHTRTLRVLQRHGLVRLSYSQHGVRSGLDARCPEVCLVKITPAGIAALEKGK